MPDMQTDQHLANQMIENAVENCARRLFGGDTQAVYHSLQQGRCDVCGQLSLQLVSQVGKYLGELDHTVKAVYQLAPESQIGVQPHGDQVDENYHPGLNLVVWVERKNPALIALGGTLENALTDSRRKAGCNHALPACFTFSLQTVDDRDILERRGMGLVVKAGYIKSMRVWSRDDPSATLSDGFELLPLNLDIVPEERLFQMAREIERLPEPERSNRQHHLRDLKVTLIRKIISDHLAYINLAREWLTFDDLETIHSRKLGAGRIGGKSAGMLLAYRILCDTAEEPIRKQLQIPESYYLGSDLMYTFMAMNGLIHWHDQKYKPEPKIRSEYQQLELEFLKGRFPPEVLVELRTILNLIGKKPVIIRSSSQLEDNFGTSFAGKYTSVFCPNQDNLEENLIALTRAIASTYASTFRPEALLYRRDRKLLDYDERMAILIQVVQGERWGRYYLPFAAGVAFSHNIYRWAPEIRREDGFSRLVWGLGTRAVERVGNDYPRLVALSHPAIQPDDSAEAIRRYSQRFVDVIDLEDNALKTLPILDVLNSNYPALRLMTQLEQDGYFTTPVSRVMASDLPNLAITYDGLLRQTGFPGLLSRVLHILEEEYHTPVDIEYTVSPPEPDSNTPDVMLTLLQCRPQSSLKQGKQVSLPRNLPKEDILFTSDFIVPRGYLPRISHVVFVVPEAYFKLGNETARNEIGRQVSQLNSKLDNKSFICIGPGRWGSTNLDLGVYVAYADICNAGALVELSGKGEGQVSEASLGTHFFQDLMEAQIYPIVISLDRPGTTFNLDFFLKTPNALKDHIDVKGKTGNCLRLIDVAAYRPGHHIEVVMDDEKGQSIAYLKADLTE
jgi:hypothetical protein